MIANDINVVLPEILLAVFAMAALMYGVYSRNQDAASRMVLWATVAVMFGLGAWIGVTPAGTRMAFDGSFVNDGFARFAKVLLLWGGASLLALSDTWLTRNNLMKFEYPVLIALASVGMMIMVSAHDLMVLYMGLELQSLSLYVIAAFRRDSLRSTEAGLKYFVLGALSSGLLLYGCSLVYGTTGTTGFDGITAVVRAGDMSIGLLFGLVFLCAGMAFKVSAAPFHMWTPDVYEGAPTPVTGLFATAPKVAAAAMFARVVHDGFGSAVSDWQQILAFLSVASMFLGAIAAIGQRNIKRLMAYSSISHMGFVLMGLAAGTAQGTEAMLVYLAIYVTMNVGVFAFILNMSKDGTPVMDISALGLYSRVEPTRALCLAVLMFSLAGLPPLVGFWGKFFVLMAAVEAGMVWLAVAGVVASA
ncbi:MAG: NADH-quinone oxidoreductase subunit NuoN [Pseudomonadota bacterium]